MADAQDRKLPASPKKIRKARSEGQVARSRDLAHLLVVGAGGAVLAVALPGLGDWLSRILGAGLRFDAGLLARPDALTQRLSELGWAWLVVLLPLGALSLGLALAAGVGAGGWNFTLQPLAPNFAKLDPVSGLGRMLSGQHLGDLAKACVLALLLGLIGGAYLYTHLPQFHDALRLPLPAAIAQTGRTLSSGLALLLLALAVFAAIDVPLQRAMLARRLRATSRSRVGSSRGCARWPASACWPRCPRPTWW